MAGENLGQNSGEVIGEPRPLVPDNFSESTDAPESALINQENKAVDQQLELDWGNASLQSLDSNLSTGTSRESRFQRPESQKSPVRGQARLLRQTERIRHLEQALDQCQVYINELKLQLADQQFLEAQLATTEEMSHIQQQAIAALKIQLANQQGIASVAEVSQLEKVLPTEAVPDRMTDAAQTDLEQQITDLQALLEIQQQQTEELESENASTRSLTVNLVNQLGEAQKKVAELQNKLSDRQATLTDLEAQLRRTKAALSTQQEITTALQKTQAPESEKNKVIQGLSKNLLSAHTKIEALETEFSHQLKLQAKLQHSRQELEAQSRSYRNRIAELEQQVAEMQEQILKQAQQASEYEAAVQHWKDRYLSAEYSVSQLKSVLEQLLKDRSSNLSELMASIDSGEPEKETDPAVKSSSDSEFSELPKGLKLNLPGFLSLRRNHKS
jgi:chromosome segregation ATPase